MKKAVTCHDLVLCTNGPAGISTMERERMARNDIRICEERIARLEGNGGFSWQSLLCSDEWRQYALRAN